MNVEEILNLCQLNRIKVTVNNDKLKITSANKTISKDIENLLIENKAALVNALTLNRYADGQRIEKKLSSSNAPLSFGQLRLWFLAQLEGSSAHYNIPMALRLDGPLNRDALVRSLESIVLRHEVLRTRYVVKDELPEQVIDGAEYFTVSVEPLSDVDQIQSICTDEAITPFDLSEDSLFRARILVLSETDHVLMITMHHSVSDEWSLEIFLNELLTLYSAYSNGQESSLPELPIQYADYAHWQRNWLSGEVLQRQLEYWQGQLAGLDPLLELPTDRPRPAVKTYKGSRLPYHFSPSLLEKIKQLSQHHNVTLYMVLLSALNVLLSRYTRQTDIAVGSPIANRNRPEVEGLIGFFINTLVMRTSLSGDPSFSELLDRVREVALGAYGHQDIPFEHLVDALQPERNMSYSPLFQVMLVVQTEPALVEGFSDITIAGVDTPYDHAKFDLTLTLLETGEGLQGNVVYNSDLFDAETITRLIGHYERILEAVVADVQVRISNIDLLAEAERHQLLVEWNATERDYPKEKCIHELFEGQVELHPNKIALVYEDTNMSYLQLNELSNQVAHELTNKGIKPDDVVGLYVERSLEMVIGILGILKSGAAYVPLDPEYPQARIEFILKEADVDIVLSQRELIDRISGLGEKGKQTILLDLLINGDFLDESLHENSKRNISKRELNLCSKNLAYIIYTSGSTGSPKGVMIEHKSLVNHTLWKHREFKINDSDVLILKASVNFDMFLSELTMPLLAGSTLVICKQGAEKDPKHLVSLIRDHQVTIISFTPSMLKIVVGESGGLDSLRCVLCGGESLDFDTAKKARNTFSRSEVYNIYGPTEATIMVSYQNSELARKGNSIPIGKPISNTKFYVLDDSLQLAPIGWPGELYIGGAGVARGYLKHAELTQERFITNPFSDDVSDRLYRTGDLVRWLSEGNLEFLGRTDNQVKVRGFRVELGEVESQLLSYAAIRNCVVVVQAKGSDDKRLVAYIVTESEKGKVEPNGLLSELQSHLQKTLPDYMIPSAFVLLDVLPLTPNGKVDTKALPAPDGGAYPRDEIIAPQTETEKQLVAIWQDILGMEEIGIHDNFFELGGHSMAAMRMSSYIQQVLNCEITLRDLFQYPTIKLLSEILHKGSGSQFPREHLIKLRDGYLNPLFLVHHIAPEISPYVPFSSLFDKGIPIYGLLPFGCGDLSRLTLEGLASYHIQAMKQVQPKGPYQLAGYSAGGNLAYAIAHELLKQNEEVVFLGLVDSQNVFHETTQESNEFAQNLSFLILLIRGYNPNIDEHTMQKLCDMGKRDMESLFNYCKDNKLIFTRYTFSELENESKMIVAIINAHYDYQVQCLSCPVHLYAAEESISEYPNLGWEPYMKKPWIIEVIGGNHSTIMHSPNLQLLVKSMSNTLLKLD